MTHLEPFGDAAAWLAVLDSSQAEVAEALGLTGGRTVPVPEAIAATSTTGLLPPLPGIDGRWTLAVSTGLASISSRRLTALAALLGTQVLLYDTISDPGRRDDVLARAAAESVDPRTLSGEVPGHALLFDDLDEGPPPADLVTPPSRTPWLWSKLTGR